MPSLDIQWNALKSTLLPVRQIGPVNMARAVLAGAREPHLNWSMARRGLLNLWRGLGDREAIVDGDERITFDQYVDRVRRLANVLHSHGLRAGDNMAVLVGNGARWFEAMGATSLLGVQMPMINWHLSARETRECIALSGASALLVEDPFTEKLDADSTDRLKLLLVADGANPPAGAVSYEQALDGADTDIPAGGFHYSPRPFSGGTTGTPKFIRMDGDSLAKPNRWRHFGLRPWTLAGLVMRQMALPGWLEMAGVHDLDSGNIRSLVPGPLYHSGTQAATLPFFLGATMVPMKKFDAERFLALIEQERINWTFVAPTMLERVLALPKSVRESYDLSSMRILLCGAAPCPPQVKIETNRLFRRQGNERDVFHEYYGSSEASIVTLLLPRDYRDNPHRYDSVGKVRAAECGIWNAETERWAETGEDGRILIRSPAVYALSYAGFSEEDMDRSFVRVNGTLWYDDGLIGHLDEDGFLYITGRIKEMIITGGVNIYPNEIEDVLKRHPEVHDAAVVPAPNDDLGEVAAAFIQPRDPDNPPAAETLVAFCKQQGLYGYKMPRHIEIMADLPRDIAGKLRKAPLKKKLMSEAGRPRPDA